MNAEKIQSIRAALRMLVLRKELAAEIAKAVELKGEDVQEILSRIEEVLEKEISKPTGEEIPSAAKPKKGWFEQFIAEALGMPSLSLPSGIRVSFLDEEIENGRWVYLHFEDLITRPQEPGDPWLAIEVPIDKGDPTLTLCFYEDDKTAIKLARGEPVWKILESILRNLHIEHWF